MDMSTVRRILIYAKEIAYIIKAVRFRKLKRKYRRRLVAIDKFFCSHF